MSKSMVDRLFIGAIVAVIAGWVVAIVAMIAALAGGAVAIGGPTVVTVNGEAFASALLARRSPRSLSAAAPSPVWRRGSALLQHGPPDDKTWFVVLLFTGSGASASSRWLPTSSPGRTALVAMPRVPAWQPLRLVKAVMDRVLDTLDVRRNRSWRNGGRQRGCWSSGTS